MTYKRNIYITTYLITLFSIYVAFLLLQLPSYLRHSYTWNKIAVSPFGGWLYITVCGGCINNNLYFALWMSIPLLLLSSYFIVRSILNIRIKDFIISEILLILFLTYPVWFRILRGQIFDAGLFPEYFSYCCE